MRSAPRRLCLLLLALGAFGCRGDEPEAAAPAGEIASPAWAERLCDHWVRLDGTCDLDQLTADYEECYRTQGVPQRRLLEKRGVRSRAQNRAAGRKTHLCLELRQWRMTQQGLDDWQGSAAQAPPPT
jgi:hypothetical protein